MQPNNANITTSAQEKLLPALKRFIKAKQGAIKEVQYVATMCGLPEEDLVVWFFKTAGCSGLESGGKVLLSDEYREEQEA